MLTVVIQLHLIFNKKKKNYNNESIIYAFKSYCKKKKIYTTVMYYFKSYR